MRISRGNLGMDMAQASPRETDTSAIDNQIRQLEKRKKKLEKELKDPSKNPEEMELLSKEMQMVHMEIAALTAARENIAALARAQSTQTSATKNVSKDVGHDRYDDSSVGKENGNEGVRTGVVAAESASTRHGEAERETPPLLGKRPGVYSLKLDENGEYRLSYELDEEREHEDESESLHHS